jgi:hypothetical protein
VAASHPYNPLRSGSSKKITTKSKTGKGEEAKEEENWKVS